MITMRRLIFLIGGLIIGTIRMTNTYTSARLVDVNKDGIQDQVIHRVYETPIGTFSFHTKTLIGKNIWKVWS